jgi:TetR/AcrR family transcriptional regulator, cholesterol catabolism regulator
MAEGDDLPKSPSKSQVTRRLILEAAARLFREKGYAAVSLREIAQAVNMKTGSLYYHFDSKESLVEEILTLGTLGAMTASKAAVAALGPDADPVDKLEAVFCAHTCFLHEEEDFASANLKILQQVPPAIRERHVRQDREYGAFVAAIIDEIAASRGLAPGVDVSVLRMLCFGAMNWSISWYDPTGRSPGQIAEQLMTLVRRGALASPQVEPPERRPRNAKSKRRSAKASPIERAGSGLED